MKRYAIYEMSDGSTEEFEIGTYAEAEQHERSNADRAMHDPKSGVVSYHFEWRDDTYEQQ